MANKQINKRKPLPISGAYHKNVQECTRNVIDKIFSIRFVQHIYQALISLTILINILIATLPILSLKFHVSPIHWFVIERSLDSSYLIRLLKSA